jgi:hypothetical protein
LVAIMSGFLGQAKRLADSALSVAQRMIQRGRVSAVNALLRGQIKISLDGKDNHVDTEYWQLPGFIGIPRDGGDALYVLVNGNPRQAIVLATRDFRYAPTDLAKGDAAIYAQTDTDRAEVRAKIDGDVDLSAPGAGKTVNVGGDSQPLMLSGDMESRMQTLFTDIASGPPITAAILALYLAKFSVPPYGFAAQKGRGT